MEFTHEQISEIISSITSGKEGLQGLVKMGMESLMKSERDIHNEQTTDVSNGFRDRRICHNGKMFEIKVPRSRENNFYPMLLGVLKDQEAEVQRLICSLYSQGLTTSQVGKISEEFYGKHYSKGQVSRLLNGAREDVGLWLKRGLEYRYPIIYIDATYVLTRRDSSVSNEAYYTVLGVREDRTREVLDIVNFPTESSTNWKDVFDNLKERGLSFVDLVVCDGLSGIENSITACFPMADIQLCTVHLKRNIVNKVKPRDKREVSDDLKKIFFPDQFDITCDLAYERFMAFINKWQGSYPALKRYKHERYRLYFTYFKYERAIRGMIYTTNWIERLNRDYKRVLNMRGAMPNPESVILLMGNVAQNRDVHKYPIYNFLESKLFNII
jgi:transposase-like protein